MSNPITIHRHLVRSQMPKGAGQHRSHQQHRLKKRASGTCITFVGTGLIAWLIKQGHLNEAKIALKKLEGGVV